MVVFVRRSKLQRDVVFVLAPRFDSSFYFISFYALKFPGTEEKITRPLVLVLQSIVCLCDVDFVEVAGALCLLQQVGAVFSTVLCVPLNKNGIQLKW